MCPSQRLMVKTTYKNLGDYGFLNHAEDLFVDSQDNLYVADTGNNRILKFSTHGEVVAEYTEGFGVSFKNPKGIYVHEDGTLWIADTGNYRVVRIAQDGSDVEVFYKPESELLEESFTLRQKNLCVWHGLCLCAEGHQLDEDGFTECLSRLCGSGHGSLQSVQILDQDVWKSVSGRENHETGTLRLQ